MRRRSWLPPLVGAAVLAAVVWNTGTGPFVAGVRALDAGTLLLGAALAVPTTVACAWRWRLVARDLGVGIDLGPALAACYRAQLLNTTLPGGVLGDVHRGVRHGRDAGTVVGGLRSVVWERLAGQVVQAVLVLAALLVLPSPVRSAGRGVLVLLVVGLLGAVVVLRRLRSWPGVVVASVVAVAGHLATYLLAARAVGTTASTATLVPLALIVLVAAGLPLNLAGWGPREGMAAWTFAAAGLGAEVGVATAVAYGAIVLVANVPGAVVLLAPRRTARASAVPAGGG